MKCFAIIAAAALVAGCHSLDHYVQPFGKDTYRIDDGDAVSIANKYCARSAQAMQPVERMQGNVLTFTCVPREVLTGSGSPPQEANQHAGR